MDKDDATAEPALFEPPPLSPQKLLKFLGGSGFETAMIRGSTSISQINKLLADVKIATEKQEGCAAKVDHAQSTESLAAMIEKRQKSIMENAQKDPEHYPYWIAGLLKGSEFYNLGESGEHIGWGGSLNSGASTDVITREDIYAALKLLHDQGLISLELAFGVLSELDMSPDYASGLIAKDVSKPIVGDPATIAKSVKRLMD